MNAGKAVYGILSANSGVTDIVGTNIFPEIAEQETAVPFIVYQLQSVDPDDTHDGPSKLDEVRFEFLCYADSYNAAADLGVAVRAALDRVSGTYNGVHVESIQFNDVDVNIEYDPRRYSQVLTFTFRIKRDDVTIALGTPVTGAVLGDLSDVDVTGVTNGQLIAYNSTSGNWEAANDAGGANELSDLSDANVSLPSDGEVLIYSGGEFVNDNIAISNVTNLQTELDATPDSLDDLTDVKIVGTPSEGEALVYSSGFWSRGTAGASTLGDLTDVNLTTPSTGAYLQYDGNDWIDSVITLPSVPSTFYHNRYATEAETLRAGATATVELYYTAQADGDGLAESASSDTATAGYDIRRKLYYSEAAQSDPDTGTWTQFTAIADNTTFANAKAALLAYLKERTGGTVPISLKQTWEEVAQAPAFTGLLNETYGSGAAAAYSVRRLNGNYTGAAIQVERSSDNSYQDIGFDVDGNLDESALTTFCTGTTCKVRTWYDQSVTGGTGSGNDAVQTTHANQPTIYTGGAIVKKDGRAAVEFDGTDDFMQNSVSVSQPDSIFYLSTWPTLDGNTQIMFDGIVSTNRQGMAVDSDTGVRLFADTGNYATDPMQTGNKTLTVAMFNGSSSTLHLNSGSISINGVGSESLTGNTIGAVFNGALAADTKSQEFILYDSDKSTDRTSIESNIGDYFTQNTPLLDTYTGAAAAYSLRKLRTAYTGSAIRVRRASDNTEQDIGFNVFGELDTVSLASFCSGTNGFVKTWYCQSGNANDATQTTAANQPKIYDSSTGVLTENGKPAVEFDGSNDLFTDVTGLSFNTNDVGAFVVCRATSTGGGYGTALNIGPGLGTEIAMAYRTERFSYCGTEQGTGNSDLTQNLVSLYADNASNDVKGYIDQVQKLSTTTVSNSKSSFEIANLRSLGSTYWPGTIQEIVFYASSSKADHTNIEDNINTFYSIY